MTTDDYVLDETTVRDFVATVQERIGRAGSPEQACEAIRPAFAELLADAEWLPAEYRREAPDSGMGAGIGQWLLYRSGDSRPRPPRLGARRPLPGRAGGRGLRAH